jgi:predicted TIM-barrel fold metal-dependent hydrolase
MAPDVAKVLDLMDSCNIATLVNLDGRWGAELEENLDRYDRAHPGRFVTFCHVDWSILQGGASPDELVASMERSIAAGARGLKVWKDLGLQVTRGGDLLLPDAPILDPVWEAAGSLGLPVLIHVADPLAFFRPVDTHNERLEELLRHPRASLSRYGVEHYARLTDALEAIVARWPGTTFIGAHAGCFPEDLAWVGQMMDRYANFYVDIGAQAAELGRRPRASARLFEAHPTRILFGTDIFPLRSEQYRVYFRMLETDDEYFAYSPEAVPPNGRWTISGLSLADATLERIYRENARVLLGDAIR